MNKFILILFSFVFFAGCNGSVPKSTVTINTIKGPITFNVDIADTAQERAVGLMGRASLPKDQGMLFVYDDIEIGVVYFWMKNTLLSLDIIFIGEDGHIYHMVDRAQPCKEVDDANCPIYSSMVPIKYVLEIPGNVAVETGIDLGDVVEINIVEDQEMASE